MELFWILVLGSWSFCAAAQPRQVSGIYPHLAMFNDEAECGTGAVVPWADRLWVITYAPHKPRGSTDKLYEITPDLQQIVRAESVGGTPANRMLHDESQQLIIGPYFIDRRRNVRVVAPNRMPGRLTGNARHLTNPSNLVYFATMEEGFYEVDVHSLVVRELHPDANAQSSHGGALLPGYHGKGLYSGQGRLIYANNGELSPEAQRHPDIASGVLAEWQDGAWRVVRRNQFTEVTGPGGLRGNPHPARDPIWSIGWDHRSLLLLLLDGGQWHTYRLPKGSHCYDGAHGWNTEWPRIREIGGDEDPLLMTMHGTFWRFPKTFSAANSAGLAPRSTYLKVIGDFCRWNDRVVFGCDDTARSEFLNKRKAKGNIAGPGRSQSNLWFVEPKRIDTLGPVLGRGAVWLEDPVKAGVPSDPFLLSGYPLRSIHLSHDESAPVHFEVQVDVKGQGEWKSHRTIEVPAHGYTWMDWPADEPGVWFRVTANRDCSKATVFFHGRNSDPRPTEPSGLFASLAKSTDRSVNGGLLHARGAGFNTLRFIARSATGELGCYDLDGGLNLRLMNDPADLAWTRTNVAIPRNVFTIDEASVLYVDDQGGRWRLPKGDFAWDKPGVLGPARVCREVYTERDLFNAHGTFYELPAENAGGFAKVRPIATHNRAIHDYASFRGMLVISGLDDSASAGEHVIRSDDGRCALWVGVVDDLWQLGKPRGVGGPWHRTPVMPGTYSDPYLMTGYDRKRLTLSQAASVPVSFRVQVDLSGTGLWRTYGEFTVEPGRVFEHAFPAAFAAYWVRLAADRETVATATFHYD